MAARGRNADHNNVSAPPQRLGRITTTNHIACPTAIVEAPVSVVWGMLTDISGWGSFYNVRVIRVDPPGPAVKGQRMLGESGPRWLHLGISFEYALVDPAHYKLELDATFPMGIAVHEAMDCVPLEHERCRVNYHCDFAFHGGWGGRLTRALLSRRLEEGPKDSLSRLKRAAEKRHRGRHLARGDA